MCAQRNKSRVNLNIPRGLKEATNEEGINFSKVLENALKIKLKDFSTNAFSGKGSWCGRGNEHYGSGRLTGLENSCEDFNLRFSFLFNPV